MCIRPRRFLSLFFLLGLCAAILIAQSPQTGAFSGKVLDEEGKPLVGAKVLFHRLDYEYERQTETDERGEFFYGGFLFGPYRVSVLREGQVVWTTQVTMPGNGAVLEFTIDLKQMKEEAERSSRLDPELERRQQAERQREAREEELQRIFAVATRYLEEDRPQDAVREYQAALKLEPSSPSVQSLLCLAYGKSGQLAEAIASCRRALELEPSEAAHHNNLGTFLIADGQVEEGVHHLEQAARLDADRAATYQFNVGAALLNAGRTRDSVGHFRQALRSDPTMAVAHFFLGVALLRSTSKPSSNVEAVEAFQHYLQLAPDGEYAEGAREYLKQLDAVPPGAPSSSSSPRNDS